MILTADRLSFRALHKVNVNLCCCCQCSKPEVLGCNVSLEAIQISGKYRKLRSIFGNMETGCTSENNHLRASSSRWAGKKVRFWNWDLETVWRLIISQISAFLTADGKNCPVLMADGEIFWPFDGWHLTPMRLSYYWLTAILRLSLKFYYYHYCFISYIPLLMYLVSDLEGPFGPHFVLLF